MSNTAPSRADPVVVFPLGRWCPPQETSQPHPPPPHPNVMCYCLRWDITTHAYNSQSLANVGPTMGRQCRCWANVGAFHIIACGGMAQTQMLYQIIRYASYIKIKIIINNRRWYCLQFCRKVNNQNFATRRMDKQHYDKWSYGLTVS